MKGIWLCIGCIVLIFSWLPVYSSFFFLVGALWFLHKRFHRGEIVCLVFCLLVFVRIQCLSDVHEISFSYREDTRNQTRIYDWG